MAQVDYDNWLAGLKFVLQFVRCNAVTFDLPQKTLPVPPAVENVGNDPGGKQEQQVAAEALHIEIGAIELLAEDKPEPRERACPQQSPQKIEEQEPWKIDAHHARQGWCRRVEAGYELTNKQRARSEFRERGFGAADTGVRLKGDAA